MALPRSAANAWRIYALRRRALPLSLGSHSSNPTRDRPYTTTVAHQRKDDSVKDPTYNDDTRSTWSEELSLKSSSSIPSSSLSSSSSSSTPPNKRLSPSLASKLIRKSLGPTELPPHAPHVQASHILRTPEEKERWINEEENPLSRHRRAEQVKTLELKYGGIVDLDADAGNWPSPVLLIKKLPSADSDEVWNLVSGYVGVTKMHYEGRGVARVYFTTRENCTAALESLRRRAPSVQRNNGPKKMSTIYPLFYYGQAGSVLWDQERDVGARVEKILSNDALAVALKGVEGMSEDDIERLCWNSKVGVPTKIVIDSGSCKIYLDHSSEAAEAARKLDGYIVSLDSGEERKIHAIQLSNPPPPPALSPRPNLIRAGSRTGIVAGAAAVAWQKKVPNGSPSQRQSNTRPNRSVPQNRPNSPPKSSTRLKSINTPRPSTSNAWPTRLSPSNNNYVPRKPPARSEPTERKKYGTRDSGSRNQRTKWSDDLAAMPTQPHQRNPRSHTPLTSPQSESMRPPRNSDSTSKSTRIPRPLTSSDTFESQSRLHRPLASYESPKGSSSSQEASDGALSPRTFPPAIQVKLATLARRGKAVQRAKNPISPKTPRDEHAQ